MFFFFFSSRRRHTRYWRDWSSDVCSSDLYGALKREIPFTFWVMVIGTLAITGVGIAGIGFAGFWSKDAILEASWASGSVPGTIAFWTGALAALLTSFYSWRLLFLTFFGKARWGDRKSTRLNSSHANIS